MSLRDRWEEAFKEFMAAGMLRHEAEAAADFLIYNVITFRYPMRNG